MITDQQILAWVECRLGSFSIDDMLGAFPAIPRASMHARVSKLVARGLMRRISRGELARNSPPVVFPPPGAEWGKIITPLAPAGPELAPQFDASALRVVTDGDDQADDADQADDQADEFELEEAPLQYAAWNDGQLLIKRGEAEIAIRREEFRELCAWVARLPL